MLVPKATDITPPTIGTHETRALKEQFLPRANAEKMSVYFSQMRAMLNAGVGLEIALDEMGRSAPNADLRRACAEMKTQMSQGRTWSDSMRAYPGIFSPMMVSLVAAGEKSGNLVEICGELSEFAEQEYKFREMYKRETWYTKLLLFVSTIVFPFPFPLVIFGTTIVFGFKEQLILIGGPWLAWIIASWVWPVLSPGKPRLVMDRWKLQLPVVKKVSQSFAVAKTWRVLAMLYKAGVSLPTALRIAADACGNAAFGKSLRDVAPRLERGESLTATLTSTGEFPVSALGLLRTGEESGDLDKTLPLSVRFLEMDAQTTLYQATKTITTILYILVAFKIGAAIIYAWTGKAIQIGMLN